MNCNGSLKKSSIGLLLLGGVVIALYYAAIYAGPGAAAGLHALRCPELERRPDLKSSANVKAMPAAVGDGFDTLPPCPTPLLCSKPPPCPTLPEPAKVVCAE